MPTNSPINGLPSPDDNSPNDPPIHFNALANVLDTRLIARFATTTARDSAITAPVNGMTVWCDSPGAYYDRVGGAWLQRQATWTTFTPGWTASSGAPSIGNGTLKGRYLRDGMTCHFRLEFKTGSTTNGGTGPWTFTGLPLAASPSVEQPLPCKAFTNGTGTVNWVGFALFSGTSLIPYLPLSDASSSLGQVCNADSTGVSGTGIPAIGGSFTFTGPTARNLVVYGSYEIA